jgi:hypothetical protein
MHASYADRSPEDYHRLGTAIAQALEERSQDHNWLMRLLHVFVIFNLDDFSTLTSSLWIWFYAGAHSPDAALASREVLISSLQTAFADERLISFFEEESEENDESQ